jgi:hypothetical protein
MESILVAAIAHRGLFALVVIGLYPDHTRTSVSDMRDEVSKIAAFEVVSCDSSVV